MQLIQPPCYDPWHQPHGCESWRLESRLKLCNGCAVRMFRQSNNLPKAGAGSERGAERAAGRRATRAWERRAGGGAAMWASEARRRGIRRTMFAWCLLWFV